MTTRAEDLEALLSLVAKLRQTQRRYFKTRDREALVESKQIEGQVDALVARLTSRQPALFAQSGGPEATP